MNHQPLHPSHDDAERHLADISEALEAVREGRGPDMDAIAWPSGLDRENIFGLPISVRTRNCLLAERLHEGTNPLTVYKLRRVQNFGFTSLQDLLLGLEKFLVEYMRVGATEPHTEHRRTERAPDTAPVSCPPSSPPVTLPSYWQDAGAYPQPLQPSLDTARAHLSAIEDALGAAREGNKILPTTLVWPNGLDRSLLLWLPIAVRTRNCLQQANLMEGDTPLRALDLLHLPNFGRTSLADLLLTVEKFLLDCTHNTNPPSTYRPRWTATSRNIRNDSAAAPNETEAPFEQWNRAGEILRPLLATSADLLGTRTLADALHPELMRLASKMRIAPTLQSIRIDEAIEGTPSLPVLVASRLRQTLDATSERQHIIVRNRLIQTPPATLEEVGFQIGVTRERIRQIQAKLEQKIDAALGKELGVIASTLQDQFDPMVPHDDLERRIEEVVPDESPIVTGLFRKALMSSIGYTLNDGVYVDERAVRVLRSVRTRARTLADDVGLVHENQLIENLPGEEWRRFWPWLRERSDLHTLNGMLALRDSAKARVKAALLSIGHPATREEIGSVCGYEKTRVGAYLSNVPSVVRADKERWGLREWIDDEYDGIVGEIIQRIEEDGGATTTERLLTELPSKFNVSPMSVRAYMQTQRFEIRDGSISLASASSVQLRYLEDVIHGRDDNGAPYWTFVVESRYLEGYSVVGIPPEFAKELGCSPDSGLGARIENLPNCRELSLRWRLASTTGASLGYLSEPLRQLGLHPGDHARVTIKGTRSVELSAEDGSAQTRPTAEADAVLERILRRRRAL